MRPRTAALFVLRSATSATTRARRTRKERHNVTIRQWLGYAAVAAVTTWLTKELDDLVERRFGSEATTR